MQAALLVYSAIGMATPTRHSIDGHEIVERLSGYLDRLLAGPHRATERVKDRVAERLANRVEVKVAARLDSRIATLEVLLDEEALDDLRASSQDSDTDLRDYEEIRREAGLA